MSITLYGIKNCDTVKKARKWLDTNSVPYTFHDFRVDGISKTLVSRFLKQVDVETLINKRGTTWRKLSDKEKEIKTKTQAIELMVENPAIIKRPVLNVNKKVTVGFSEEVYKSINFFDIFSE